MREAHRWQRGLQLAHSLVSCGRYAPVDRTSRAKTMRLISNSGPLVVFRLATSNERNKRATRTRGVDGEKKKERNDPADTHEASSTVVTCA